MDQNPRIPRRSSKRSEVPQSSRSTSTTSTERRTSQGKARNDSRSSTPERPRKRDTFGGENQGGQPSEYSPPDSRPPSLKGPAQQDKSSSASVRTSTYSLAPSVGSMNDGGHGLAHRAQPDKAATVVEQQLKKLRMEQREAAETKEQPEWEEAALEEQRKKKEAALKKQQKQKKDDAQKWLQGLMQEGLKKQREKEEAELEERRRQKEETLEEKRLKVEAKKQREGERETEREKKRKKAFLERKEDVMTEVEKLETLKQLEDKKREKDIKAVMSDEDWEDARRLGLAHGDWAIAHSTGASSRGKRSDG